MDYESWFKGYETGVMLHNHLRDGKSLTGTDADGNPLSSAPLVSMSVAGIASYMEWHADLSGVEALTMLKASYSGSVMVAYGYGGAYTEFMPIEELLATNPTELFSGADTLYFRFHLADDTADLRSFQLYGVLKKEKTEGED